MKKNLVLVFIAAIAACSAPHKETEPTVWEGIRYIPLQWERLPDMNHPRAGHVLLPVGGEVLAAGGTDGSNYEPTAAAFLLSPTPRRDKGGIPWLPLVLVLALGVGGASGWVLSRKKAGPPAPAVPVTPDMMTRILRLMEEKQLFRRSNLRLQDLATELGTNVTYISACINDQTGKTFPEFVSAYRIRYAQKMMQGQPDKLLSEVGLSAGFANDKSFFRTFKASTGMTPSEWNKNLSIHDK